jgi:hypothetical protein
MPAALTQFRISFSQVALDLNRAVDRIHHAVKLSKDIIPREVQHPAPVLLDEMGHCGSVGGGGSDGCLFIIPHQVAVAFNISTQDGGQSSFELLCVHAYLTA